VYTLCNQQEIERASKALRLNGGPGYNPATEKLLAASSKEKINGKNKAIRFKTTKWFDSSKTAVGTGKNESNKGLKLNGLV
jgi:hypothetical protein